MDNTWQNLYYDLKADSHREHNSYQKEIDAATKQAAEWETRYNAVHNRAKELHRKAYPERYRLSSGAELVSGWRNRATHVAPVLAVLHPICRGTITTRTNSKNRSSKDGDKEVWNQMNTTEKYSVNYIGLQENIKQIPCDYSRQEYYSDNHGDKFLFEDTCKHRHFRNCHACATDNKCYHSPDTHAFAH